MTPPRSLPDGPGPAPDQAPDNAPYPALYEEPWGRLAGDLRAVVASAGLKLRELWRRNREGDLSVPGFWPVPWAPLFWPLLLALGLSVVVGLVTLAQPKPLPHTLAPPPLELPPQSSPESPPQSSPQSPPPSPPPSFSQPPAEPLLVLNPLLALLAEDDPQACIVSARPDPQAGRLDLELTVAYQALPTERRQELADHWLQRSRELGYERLRLLDGSGTVVGQAARVGSGMVLLEPIPGPQP